MDTFWLVAFVTVALPLYAIGFLFVAFHAGRGYMSEFTDVGLLGGAAAGVLGILVGLAAGAVWPVCLLGYVLVKRSTGEPILKR